MGDTPEPLALGHPEFEVYANIDNGGKVTTTGTSGSIERRALPDQEGMPTTIGCEFPFFDQHDGMAD